MNWQAIGAVGEILGAVAVLVTLVYLAFQIRQNTLTSRAVMHHQIATEYNRLHEITMAHPHIADVMARAGDTEGDVQTRALAFWLTNRYWAIQTAYDNGQISRAIFDEYVVDFARSLRVWPAIAPIIQENVDSSPYANAEIFGPLRHRGAP